MVYLDQSVDDLKVTLIKGEFDISSLQLISAETINLESYQIIASIIGASHAISFINKKTKKVIFTEVVANYDVSSSQDQETINNSLVIPINQAIAKDIKAKETDINSVSDLYHIKAINLDLTNPDEADIVKNFANIFNKNSTNNTNNTDPATDDGGRLFLSFTFPSNKKPKSDIEAKTQVSVNVVENVVDINTIHVYPNEARALFTRTQTELKQQ